MPNNGLLETLMEKSVLPSFSSIGPAVRRRLHNWPTLESYSLQGKVVVLSGATSGIGEAAAELYAALGATLVIIARNADKAKSFTRKLEQRSENSQIHTMLADLGDIEQVRSLAVQLNEQFPIIDILAHNAGALFNVRKRAANGTDLSIELMVSTPFLLTGLLLGALGHGGSRPRRSCPGRVLSMSSGGMYFESLNVEELELPNKHYQGAKQYARAKRAQVILNELWAERVSPCEVVFHALHPGWVLTPGISNALPDFVKLLAPLGLLRSPQDGADTLVWLSADPAAANTSGKFWHDRAIRDIDWLSKTRRADTRVQREALWQWCESHSGWQFPSGDQLLH